MRTTLIVAGVLLDLTGITLLALDVLAEPVRHGWIRLGASVATARARLRRTAQRVWNRLRRRTVVPVPAGGVTAGGIAPTGHVSLRRLPGLESPDLIAWLREEVIEIGNRTAVLEGAAAAAHAETQRQVRELAEELRAAIGAAIAQSERAYRGWRLLGFMLAIIGVTLTLIGSLLPS